MAYLSWSSGLDLASLCTEHVADFSLVADNLTSTTSLFIWSTPKYTRISIETHNIGYGEHNFGSPINESPLYGYS